MSENNAYYLSAVSSKQKRAAIGKVLYEAEKTGECLSFGDVFERLPIRVKKATSLNEVAEFVGRMQSRAFRKAEQGREFSDDWGLRSAD